MKRAGGDNAGGGGKKKRAVHGNQRKGFTGRLSKGAGTHLASWLQEVDALTIDEAQSLLDNHYPDGARSTPRGERAWAGLLDTHGKRTGHAKKITDVAYSGDLLVTKDPASMRLWRTRGDFALLRVVSCRGKHVAIHPCGQFIVTGTRGAGAGAGAAASAGAGTDDTTVGSSGAKRASPKIWGPAGGSAFTAGKKSITHGMARGGAGQRKRPPR